MLLALMADRPMHGYELMSELARLFGPEYRPSPGTVYPAVDALEGEHLIRGASVEGRTTYETTPAGAAALEERAEALAALEVRTGARVRRSDSLDAPLARFTARLAPLSGRVEPEAVAEILDRAAAEIESLDGLANKERSA
ncbi:MAG: PadR family transcriptional regulator [Thermoleophilaceae bacterium]